MNDFIKDTMERFEDEFEERINYVNYCLSEGDEMLDKQELKSFITSTLLAQQEMLRGEVEKMRKLEVSTNLDGLDTEDYELVVREKRYRDAFNNAVDDILNLLSPNKE